MALVSKIREKSGLIVFIVGLGLLLFIIPFDSIYAFFGGRGEQPIGEVYGSPIYPSEWDVMADFNQNTGYYSTIPNGETYKMYEARNFFQRKMFDTIMNTEIEKIGLRVSSAELKDYLIFGEYPSPVIVERYTYEDAQGNESFSRDSLLKEYNFFVNQAAAAQGSDKARFTNYWHQMVEVPVRKERLVSKYTAMAKFAVVGTTDEATKLQIAQNSKLVVDFVAKEVSTVMDSSVTVSESDIKTYYEAHKDEAEWKLMEDMAKIEFVLIDIEPTDEDKTALMEKMTKMKKGFAEAPNDTAFVSLKSDVAFGESMQDPTKFDVIPGADFAGLFSEKINTEIQNAKAGDVVGPFTYTWQAEEIVVLAKVRDVAQETKVRHILVADENLADSIATVLKADTSQFASLCETYSQDPGFAENGGYYDVGPSTRFVPSFKAFSLANGVGTIDIVPSQFGYHVIEVVEKGEEKRAMAYIVKDIVATDDTRNYVYEELGFGFMKAAQTDYDAALKKFGFESFDATLSISLPLIDLGGNNTIYNEELVNWLFAEARQAGEVSIPVALKDGRFLVARVKGKSSFGVPTYDIIKDEMEAKLLKEAKLTHIKKQLKGVGTLKAAQEVLGAVGGVRENTEVSLDMDAFPGLGQDVTAIAKTFMIKNLNELTIVEGKQGIYVVVVKERKFTPVSADKTEAIAKVSANRQSYVGRTINGALLRMADVRDWRVKAQVYYANQE